MLSTARNILIQIELDNKKKYRFSNGLEIVIERGYNYNLREDAASFGKIVNGENVPKDAICLLHHNSSHDSFKVFGVKDENGKEIENLFSVAIDMVYCYMEEGKEWQPMPEYLITKRLFEPYKGSLTGIDAALIPQRLFVVKGVVPNYEVEKKVLAVTKFSDYSVIFHKNGRESTVTRTRLRECLAIDNYLTEQVLENKILIGNDLKDAQFYGS